MLEIINSVACIALMGYSLPVAMLMGNRGMWLERLSLVAVQFGLFLQLTNPWASLLPEVTWTQVYLNAVSALMLTAWWRRAWIFARSYLSPSDGSLKRKRRRTDWGGSIDASGATPHPNH